MWGALEGPECLTHKFVSDAISNMTSTESLKLDGEMVSKNYVLRLT